MGRTAAPPQFSLFDMADEQRDAHIPPMSDHVTPVRSRRPVEGNTLEAITSHLAYDGLSSWDLSLHSAWTLIVCMHDQVLEDVGVRPARIQQPAAPSHRVTPNRGNDVRLKRLAETVRELMDECHTLYPAVFPPASVCQMSDRGLALIAEVAAGYDLLTRDTGAFEAVSIAWAVWGETNSALGQFFTPYNLSLMMAKMSDPEPGMTVLDPCVGAGAMLVATFDVMRAKIDAHIDGLTRETVRLPPGMAVSDLSDDEFEQFRQTTRLMNYEEAGTRLTGIDIDARAAWLARANLTVRIGTEADVRCGDSLLQPDISKIPLATWPGGE